MDNLKIRQIALAVIGIAIIGFAIWWGESKPQQSPQTNETKTESTDRVVSPDTVPIVDPAIYTKSPEQIHSDCEARGESSFIFDCYSQALHDYMVETDARKTLELLGKLSQLGGYSQSNCHPLSHKIGNIAVHVYGSVLAASPYYLPTCYSGYYHGLLEEYIATEPDLKTAVTTACGTYDSSKVYFDWFQCDHGLGHGIMQYEQDDVLASLKDCDLVDSANFAREICYGGVFMENITTDEKTGHPSKFIKTDDPIYPCDIVEVQYKGSCYFLSSSMILRLNGYNFQAGFKSCDTAEKAYIYLCYQSMGRDISGAFHNSIDKVNELCPQGNPEYVGDCYYGAVRDFINAEGEFDTALPMCAATPEDYKSRCYNAMIYDLGLLKTGMDYTNVCNQMPEIYKNQCLQAKKS